MTEEAIQLPLTFSGGNLLESPLGGINRESNGRANKLDFQDRAFHDWYRFILSYPPHLVRDYLEDFGLDGSHTVLDPFCGTGTTLVESRLNGIKAVGLEANPLAHFASSVKLDWDVDPDELEERTREIGVRIAVGARRRDIFAQFMVQTILITALGGVLGIILGFSILKAVGSYLDLQVIASVQMIWVALLVSVGVGLIFGISPAMRASKLDPVEALRED